MGLFKAAFTRWRAEARLNLFGYLQWFLLVPRVARYWRTREATSV